MSWLVLDASGAVASAAVLHGAQVLAAGTVAMKDRTREPLLPLLLALCDEAGVGLAGLTRVVVGDGPGAFTSLRIAAATAKGLVHGTSVELAAVSSLVLGAASAGDAGIGTRRLATCDALRGECFAQVIARTAAGWVADGPVSLVAADAVAETARVAAAEWCPVSAVTAAALTAVAPAAVRVVDVATWEPAYGRLAEAQVKWEATHGAPLSAAPLRTVESAS